jgi:hypothetical protein
LQVPTPESLRDIEPREAITRRLHAEADYTGAWLTLFEQVVRYGTATTAADHPVVVNGRYLMAPSPIPRFDNHKLNQAEHLTLLGAGREKKIYAVPPYTSVVSLDFEDYPFAVEGFPGATCRLCGAEDVYFDELVDERTGETYYQCNDTSFCACRRAAAAATVPEATTVLAAAVVAETIDAAEVSEVAARENIAIMAIDMAEAAAVAEAIDAAEVSEAPRPGALASRVAEAAAVFAAASAAARATVVSEASEAATVLAAATEVPVVPAASTAAAPLTTGKSVGL